MFFFFIKIKCYYSWVLKNFKKYFKIPIEILNDEGFNKTRKNKNITIKADF